jgi:SAM-dependent methyltransferase
MTALGYIPFEELTIRKLCGPDNFVCYWPPRREEIGRMVAFTKAIHQGKGKPKMLEIGCGTGLLAYLLASTGQVDVIATDPDVHIESSPYSHPNLKFERLGAYNAATKYQAQGVTAVVNSWMPYNLDLTHEIRDVGALAIIYVLENCTGIEGVSYDPGDTYRQVYGWRGITCNELRTAIRCVDENNKRLVWELSNWHNIIEIQLRKGIKVPEKPDVVVAENEKYPWEPELEAMLGGVSKIKKLKNTWKNPWDQFF